MKTLTKKIAIAAVLLIALSSCRYTHGETNDSTEESATQTMAEGQGGETTQDSTPSSEVQRTVPQDSTKSSNPQGDVMPREQNGAGDNNK